MLSNLEAGDGYRVIPLEAQSPDKFLELWLQLQSSGEVQYACRVWRSPNNDVEDVGVMHREFWLWRAIAHYLNAGGKIENLRDSLQQSIFANDDFLQVDWEPGTILLDTGPADGGAQHVIANLVTSEVVIWSEDLFVVHTTLEELAAADAEPEPAGPDVAIAPAEPQPEQPLQDT